MQRPTLPTAEDYDRAVKEIDEMYEANGGAWVSIASSEMITRETHSWNIKSAYGRIAFIAHKIEPLDSGPDGSLDKNQRFTHAMKRGMLLGFTLTYKIPGSDAIESEYMLEKFEGGFRKQELSTKEVTDEWQSVPLLAFAGEGLEALGEKSRQKIYDWASDVYLPDQADLRPIMMLGCGAVIAMSRMQYSHLQIEYDMEQSSTDTGEAG